MTCLQGAEIAVNRFRECINAAAKSFAALPKAASAITARQMQSMTALPDTHISLCAESVRLQIAAACWKGMSPPKTQISPFICQFWLSK